MVHNLNGDDTYRDFVVALGWSCNTLHSWCYYSRFDMGDGLNIVVVVKPDLQSVSRFWTVIGKILLAVVLERKNESRAKMLLLYGRSRAADSQVILLRRAFLLASVVIEKIQRCCSAPCACHPRQSVASPQARQIHVLDLHVLFPQQHHPVNTAPAKSALFMPWWPRL